MFDDDLDPRTKKPVLKKLDKFSLDELNDYIELMKAEIARVEEEIGRKKAASAAASSFFKS
jgi:uncharacterized small protein (DUF1192 family)